MLKCNLIYKSNFHRLMNRAPESSGIMRPELIMTYESSGLNLWQNLLRKASGRCILMSQTWPAYIRLWMRCWTRTSTLICLSAVLVSKSHSSWKCGLDLLRSQIHTAKSLAPFLLRHCFSIVRDVTILQVCTEEGFLQTWTTALLRRLLQSMFMEPSK